MGAGLAIASTIAGGVRGRRAAQGVVSGRVRGVCKRRVSRISSGVFIPCRWINTVGAVSVARRWLGGGANFAS